MSNRLEWPMISKNQHIINNIRKHTQSTGCSYMTNKYLLTNICTRYTKSFTFLFFIIMKKLQIAIIWSAWSIEYPTGWFDFDTLYRYAYECGKLCAEQWAIVITWWKSWIMEWASKWAKDWWWITVWFVKGSERNVANPYVDIEIVTNMGTWWDGFMIPYSADGAIIVWWWVGTLKEVSWFYLANKPLVAITWTGWRAEKLAWTYLDERKIRMIQQASSPQEAVSKLFTSL